MYNNKTNEVSHQISCYSSCISQRWKSDTNIFQIKQQHNKPFIMNYTHEKYIAEQPIF